MEERLLNEKESLELITQMINSSKKNMEIGQGNYLLVWGYFTTALSIILFTLIALTHNMIWSWGWMLMFVMWPVMSYRQRQQPRGHHLYRQSNHAGLAGNGLDVCHHFPDNWHH